MAKAKARVDDGVRDDKGNYHLVVFVDIKDDDGFILDSIDQYAQTLNGKNYSRTQYRGADASAAYTFFDRENAKEFADTLNKQMLYGLEV